MEFRHLEAFIAVAQTGSFTAASAHLHLSQPAVSQLVAKLEYSVGEPLFVRSTRRLELTARAQKLLPVAYELLALRGTILDKSGANEANVRGHLRIGTSSSATAFLWAHMLSAYAKRHPLVELDIRTVSQTDQTREDLLRGKLDIGILAFPHGEARLDSIVLGNHTAELVCSPDHPAYRAGRALEAVELSEHSFLLYEKGMNFRRLADHFFDSKGMEPHVSMQSNDTYLIRTMAEIGFGLAFLPDWAIVSQLASGKLVRLNIDTGNLAEEFGLARLKSYVTRPSQSFINFCAGHRHLIPDISRKAMPENWKHFTEDPKR